MAKASILYTNHPIIGKTNGRKSNFQDKPANGRAMGFAASIDAGSPCAQVVEQPYRVAEN